MQIEVLQNCYVLRQQFCFDVNESKWVLNFPCIEIILWYDSHEISIKSLSCLIKIQNSLQRNKRNLIGFASNLLHQANNIITFEYINHLTAMIFICEHTIKISRKCPLL